MRLQAGPTDLAQGGQRQIGAALHVLGAWAIGTVALDAERQRPGQGADGMHGVNVAQYQQPRPGGGLARAVLVVDGQQMVAKPVPAGNALHPHADGFVVGLHPGGHAGHALGVIGGALDFDPGADSGQYVVHVEGLDACHL